MSEQVSEQIEVIIGQPLQITLKSMMGSTGYGWYLSKLDGGLMLSSASIQAATAGVGPILHVFDFFAAEAGAFVLEFKLVAPWRPGEPGDTKTYEVTVKKPEKTASEDIETAMKGGSFVDPSVLDADSATVLKYAAPITSIKYAAPMSQVAPTFNATTMVAYAAPINMAAAANMGFSAYPTVVYAAPMSQAGFSANPVVVYAAPMSQASPSSVAAYPNVIYAAPMSQAGFSANPVVVYAAPMSQASPSSVAAYPNVIYAAPMSQALPTMIQPYAAPFLRNDVATGQPQPLYAAPITGQPQPLYAAPITYSLPIQVLYAAPIVPRYAAPVSGDGCCCC